MPAEIPTRGPRNVTPRQDRAGQLPSPSQLHYLPGRPGLTPPPLYLDVSALFPSFHHAERLHPARISCLIFISRLSGPLQLPSDSRPQRPDWQGSAHNLQNLFRGKFAVVLSVIFISLLLAFRGKITGYSSFFYLRDSN